jgi:hypothetical protein
MVLQFSPCFKVWGSEDTPLQIAFLQSARPKSAADATDDVADKTSTAAQ